MFWGLRECRPIHFQSIQQAEVSIECSGVRITKTIRDVEKNPNFEVTSNDTDKYHLLVVRRTTNEKTIITNFASRSISKFE